MSTNPFDKVLQEFELDGKTYKYYSLPALNDPRVAKLPYSIRVLLECCVRSCDEFAVKSSDVEKILNWSENCQKDVDIPFKPSRVLMQDFTGVPAVVDLAGMRDAIKNLGGDPAKINPLVPVDLVVDHSVQVDAFGSPEALKINQDREFERNYERFQFLKWGSNAFKGLSIVPPGSGIVHQVNLEYLARVVFEKDGLLYPDSLVGTDSHTTMINGLGVVGWGVGGIEAEASMLGQPMSMVLPKVIGFKLVGKLQGQATATDLVLTITEMIRKHGAVGKFVEFYGEGVAQLSLADRATIANMSPEYGATMGYFPVDNNTLKYMKQTARDDELIKLIEAYLRNNELFVDYTKESSVEYTETLELDLATVVPSLAGPKRPQDRVSMKDMKQDFINCLNNKRGFKGFEVAPDQQDKVVEFEMDGNKHSLHHGSVVIAAITSCTNTSNPSVMLSAGLVARKALEKGLRVQPFIKTSLSPGSGVVSRYLEESGLQKDLDTLGFSVVGYGCMTCIGNSGDLPEPVSEAISSNDLVATAVLSGNRNFESRVHPLTLGNYLASPPLVVAYAIAGTVKIDFETEPIGKDKDGQDVFLRDIWPTQEEVQDAVDKYVIPDMFKDVYEKIKNGTEQWNKMPVPDAVMYPWSDESTYIHRPPFWDETEKEPSPVKPISDAYMLLNLGDSVTTDHISPAGNISIKSPAAKFLMERGVERRDFNTYGARRGNDLVMTRGTFANIRLPNKMVDRPGPNTVHVPSGDVMSVFDAAVKYKQEGHQLVVVAGSEYGSGSSRDWAAKGTSLLGVKAVIAKSYERIHRSNLVCMGVMPLQFLDGESADSLGLTGKEQFTIDLSQISRPGQEFEVQVKNNDKLKSFRVKARIDTDIEVEYYKHGGILNYVLRKLASS